MNLAFDLQESKRLREDNPLQQYKIVSLWDVLRFYANWYLDIGWGLVNTIHGLESYVTEGVEWNNRERYREFDKLVEWLHGNLGRLGLPTSAIKAQRLLVFCNHNSLTCEPGCSTAGP